MRLMYKGWMLGSVFATGLPDGVLWCDRIGACACLSIELRTTVDARPGRVVRRSRNWSKASRREGGAFLSSCWELRNEALQVSWFGGTYSYVDLSMLMAINPKGLISIYTYELHNGQWKFRLNIHRACILGDSRFLTWTEGFREFPIWGRFVRDRSTSRCRL
jgi:hypothetical protein